ncbi:uncharacterized protein LOC134776524 [Penaeus indicus]|uniref:uncharacterized protein LOC134776524 n=1 Tax=Penaeus indicus TaxID=29960 RepID=UPI00300D5433
MNLIASLLMLLTLTATQATTGQRRQETSSFVREVFPKCANITDAENMDHPAPDFVQTLQGTFTLTLEMTMMKKKMTYYVEEVRERFEFGGEVTDSGAVYLRRNGTETTYHYYPTSGMMVEEQDGQCRQTGTDVPPFNPWGWWDPDPTHGAMLYGPSALIRRASFINKRYLGGHREINGVMCERWLACEAQQSVMVYYYFSERPWQMPEAPFFNEGNGRLPVQVEVEFMDGSERIQYNVLSFVPFVRNPTLIEVTYSEVLSLSRLDYPYSTNRLKIIHDFNTGVQYVVDRVSGSCNRSWIPAFTFDSDMNTMLGPNQLFHLDDSFAFVGQRDTRGSVADLWTSTRSDLPDAATGGFQNFPKAVLEYYFVTSQEETPEGKEEINVPLRGDVFVYNNSESSEVVAMMTANIYDFSVIRLYTETEFSVEECFEKTDADWSYLVISFPSSKGSVTDLVMKNIDEFRDQIFSLVVHKGSLSPTRVASVDVSEGVAGEVGVTDFIIASVKLLDRVPYIFSYKPMLDEPHPVPGENEKSFEDIKTAEDCAELCSLEKGFQCKSFHHCDDHVCFLSPTEESDGKPVITTNNCSHWLEFATNRTFVDLPTSQAYDEILQAIRHDEFTVVILDKGTEVQLGASEAILYRSPDPLRGVRRQFTLAARRTSLKHPDDGVEQIDTLEECMTLCVTWQPYRCETFAYHFDDHKCLLSATHSDDLNSTMTSARSHADLYDRTYLSEYKVVLGGVALNGTGVVIPEVNHLDTCARHCSQDTTISCRSFEWCHEERTCRLHEEYFLDVAEGGDYETHTSCIHFSKNAAETFSQHPHQGLQKDMHRFVASNSDSSACAKLCLGSTGEVCESFDFCSTCGEEEQGVCGQGFEETQNICFLSTHHVGEAETVIKTAPNCQHYSREFFGEMDYPTWVASKRRSEYPYTSGDMAGLAVGVLLLGALLAAGFLFAIVRVRPHEEAPNEEVGVSFLHLKNAVEGESDF